MMQTKAVNPKDLSAAEILLLLEPNTPPREAFKVAFKELVALGLVRLEKIPATNRFSVATTRLHLGTGAISNPALIDLLGHLRSAMRHGPEIHKVLPRLQREYGTVYERFKGRHLLPRLVEGGLLEPQARKVLLVFNTTQYRHTALGLRLKGQLEYDMGQARQLTSQLSRQIPENPAQTAALVASLGAAVILLPELWPHFGQLNELMRQQEDDEGGAGLSFMYMASSDSDDTRPESSLGDLDQAFTSVDSSFDSSDGGGSDGGSGDGGGGE